MNLKTTVTIVALSVFSLTTCNVTQAQVISSASDGFQIKIVKTTDADPATAFDCLVNVSQWWDADHTYSGNSENLTMDLRKRCLSERLDGGFVRHMEIVFCQTGKTFRMTGGLGPLQGMGVSGAMTFTFAPNGDDGKTKLELTYNVTGSEAQKLDKIAPAIDSVLNQQLDRLRKYCDQSTSK